MNYVTRTNLNNGIESIVKSSKDFKVNKENTIVFGAENATFFFQPNIYITGNKMYFIQHQQLNKYSGLFIQTMLNKSILNCGFGYGKGLIGTRVEKRFVLLPVNSQNEPDYAFMESYMREKEKQLIEQYKIQVSNIEEVVPLSAKDWREFKLTKIFNEVQRGKRLKKDDHKNGIKPYISSTGMNNGVDGFVGNQNDVRIFSNCLTLANSGSVGATFYQPFSFVASDHVTKLENEDFNQYIYLFVSNLIRRFSEKYGFNREINDTRIKKEKILLPTNDKGEPDYVYMENYMKRLEAQKLKAYLEFKNK